MTTIRDPKEPLRGAELLAQRWDDTKPQIQPGTFAKAIESATFVWRAPGRWQRLANAWRAARRELRS